MRFVIALSAALLVEFATEVWPHLYPCLNREARQRSVRRLTLLPLVALAAAAVAPDPLNLALVCTFGWAGALDLDHHNIGLPVQALLVGLALVSAWGHELRLLSGVILGGGCLAIALAFEVWISLQLRAERHVRAAAGNAQTNIPARSLSVAGTGATFGCLAPWLRGYRPPGLGDASVFAAVGLSVGAMQLAVLVLAVILLGIAESRLGKNHSAPIGFYLTAALLLALVCLHVLPTQP